ncbi:hypothetical protein SteCoe_10903 [Stentor coeruleus]|uniref:Uncharacterized protein n=1 Tax=Stentor coeruleus TaxID=5963 RepID=A0A1R2CEL1_9CILI|nr:hypothetical protein SteCoe_10903 [Stentor coeruleus]
MDIILICPDKKKEHKISHQLLSERVKEIRDYCSTKPSFIYYSIRRKSKKAIIFRTHKQVLGGRIYHVHPKKDYRNPYSKLYTNLRYIQNLNKKYSTYNLPKKKIADDFDDIKIEPEIDEKYFAKKKTFLKGKAIGFNHNKKCASVENWITNIYFDDKLD